MPSKSQSMHNLMVWCCNDPKAAERFGIEQDVACEFVEADRKAGQWQPVTVDEKKPNQIRLPKIAEW